MQIILKYANIQACVYICKHEYIVYHISLLEEAYTIVHTRWYTYIHMYKYISINKQGFINSF